MRRGQQANVLPFPGSPRPTLPAVRTQIKSLGDGDPATRRTVRFMNLFAAGSEGAQSGVIREKALELVRGLDARDYSGQIAAVYNWVKSSIEFRGEFSETLQTPVVTLRFMAGDCDDQATFLAALLLSLGFRVRFQTVAADPSAPSEFSHVYLEVLDRATQHWTALDTTVPRASVGWRPENVTRVKTWRTLGEATAQPQTTGQAIVNLLQPLTNAYADRIRYGDKNANLSLQLGTSSPEAVWPWVFGAGLIAMVAMSGNRRHY